MFIMHGPADKRPFPDPDVHCWFLTVDDIERTVDLTRVTLLWPPYVIGADIIFLPCDFYLLSSSSSFPLA